jgi:predicted methyltransferase
MSGPLLTLNEHAAIQAALRKGQTALDCSLDLLRSETHVELAADAWSVAGVRYPYLDKCKDRTIYHWTGDAFAPIARFGTALIKLVPTPWGAPTFEIDGIKMLPTAKLSPYVDAERKVALIQPRGKRVLDTCGGLGYFAAWCLEGGAVEIQSFEKNADVIWLRELNPWSPPPGPRLQLTHGSVVDAIESMPDAAVDAILHDPPRFGIAGELYAQSFYDQLARVLVRGGRMFHYTGTPNRLTSGRDVPNEVSQRLRKAGFTTELSGDGVLAVKGGARATAIRR